MNKKLDIFKKMKILSPDSMMINLYKKVDLQIKLAFISAFVSGFLIHLYFFTKSLMNEDNSAIFYKVAYYPVLGRWSSHIFSSLIRTPYTIPIVIGLLTIMYYSLATVFTVKMFKIKKPFCIIITALLLLSFPNIAYMNSYLFSADAVGAGIFISVIACWVTIKYKQGFIIGGFFVALAMGIVQWLLGTIMTLCCILIIKEILYEEKDIKENIEFAFRFIIMGMIGIILYFLITKVTLKLGNTDLIDYKGISEMGKVNFETLPQQIKSAYTYFGHFFTGKRFYYVNKPMCIAYLSTVIVIVIVGIKSVFRCKPIQIVALCLTLMVIPICINIINVSTTAAASGPLNIYHMSYFLLLPIIMFENYNYKNNIEQLNLSKWIAYISMIVIVVNYINIDNIYYLKMDLFYQRTYALANRVLDRIEQRGEFKPNMKLAVIGSLPSDNYPDSPLDFREIQNDQAYYGQFIAFSQRQDTYASTKVTKIFTNILGVSFVPATFDEIENTKKSQEYKTMGMWPDEDSIKIIKGVAVVNLNYPIYLDDKVSENLLSVGIGNKESLPEGSHFEWYIYKNGRSIESIRDDFEGHLDYIMDADGDYSVAVNIINGRKVIHVVRAYKITR